MDGTTKKKLVKAVITVLTSICAALAAFFGLNSCGVTKAYISQPKDGSQATITIQTNNPISTEVNPQTSLNMTNQ